MNGVYVYVLVVPKPPNPRPKVIQFRLVGPEWDPLFAYAESQGVSVPVAARELLLSSMASNAENAVFLATAKSARQRMTTIAFMAIHRGMRNAMDEIMAEAKVQGIDLERIY